MSGEVNPWSLSPGQSSLNGSKPKNDTQQTKKISIGEGGNWVE